MPPQTIITEKRICISIMLLPHIVWAGLAPALFAPALLPPASLAPALSLTPISLPRKFLSHFRTHFPQILSHRNQRKAEVIPDRQAATLLLIRGRTV